MRNTFIICRKELKGYFASPIAYLLMAFFALIFGFFFYSATRFLVDQAFRAQMMGGGMPPPDLNEYIIRPLLMNASVVALFLLPMLTMRLFAEEKRSGTIELLLTSPIHDAEIILGKLSAFFTLGFTDMLICVLVGVFIFHVPFRGSVWFLMFSSFLFLFGALCWGILVSTLARSQLVAYQVGILTSFLPAFLLSGFIYSIENMPRVIQAVTYVVPARYFVSILKGVFLKGDGLRILAVETAFLFVYAALAFVLAVTKMRQKVA